MGEGGIGKGVMGAEERVEKGIMGVEKGTMGVEKRVMIGEGKQRGSNSLLSLVVNVALPRLLFAVAQMCRE